MNSKVELEQFIDQAKAVRQGEELDIAAVDAWIKQTITGLEGSPSVTQYSGGASNWTYCLSYPNRRLILRRAPAGTKAKGAHDMTREYTIQKAIKPVYSYVPEMLALCEDKSVIGTEFYLMEKLDGVIPRKSLPKGLKLEPAQVRQLCTKVLDCLIELHKVDYQAADLAHLAKGAGYVKRQIEGWQTRYRNAKTWNVPSANYVMDWLSANQPTDETISLIHNDFRFDNVVLDPNEITRVIGVLDWEMATLGDPRMDLGNSLAYWVEVGDDFISQGMRRQPTHLEGMLSRAEVIEYYADRMGFEERDFSFYEVYGLFRLVVILQQIYYRYYKKQTRNPVFKNFWFYVHYLLWRARRVIKRSGV